MNHYAKSVLCTRSGRHYWFATVFVLPAVGRCYFVAATAMDLGRKPSMMNKGAFISATAQFGDDMTPPPPEQRVPQHI